MPTNPPHNTTRRSNADRTHTDRAVWRTALPLLIFSVAALLFFVPIAPRALAQGHPVNATVNPDDIAELLPPHLGAAVLAIDDGQVVFRHAWGLRRADEPDPVSPATNFRLASVSKQFTATAVMTLVDRGLLDPADALASFFPDAPDYWQHITVHHLLTHTSGLPDYEPLVPEGTTVQLADYNVLAMLIDTATPKFPAGTRYDYSNSGYTLLALIIEQVAKQPYHQYLQDAVLEPAGMTDSLCYLAGMNSIPHRAYGHDHNDDGTWTVADQSVTSAIRGDGSVYSSLNDLAKWIAACDRNTLLKPDSANAMTTAHVQSTRGDEAYGYGWFVGQYRGTPRIWHSGSTQGFSLRVMRFPQRHAAVVILLNRSPADTANQDTDRIVDRLLFPDAPPAN